jgi:hypothetical protein
MLENATGGSFVPLPGYTYQDLTGLEHLKNIANQGSVEWVMHASLKLHSFSI